MMLFDISALFTPFNFNQMKKFIAIFIAITISISTVYALGAAGSDYDKFKQHRDDSVLTLKAQAKETCDWQRQFLVEEIAANTKPERYTELGTQLTEITTDCDKYIRTLFTRSETSQK